MSKGDRSGSLRATRTQINNANASAQMRAFKARQIAKQKRDAEERKRRAMRAGAAGATEAPVGTSADATDGAAEGADELGEPSAAKD